MLWGVICYSLQWVLRQTWYIKMGKLSMEAEKTTKKGTLASAPTCAKMKKTNKQKQSTKQRAKRQQNCKRLPLHLLVPKWSPWRWLDKFWRKHHLSRYRQRKGWVAQIYLFKTSLLLKLVIDSCLFKHTYMCWEESESVMKKTHLVGNELEEWPMSSFYDRGC